MSQDTAARWVDAIKQHSKGISKGRVLDLGCGTGRFAVLLARHFRATVVGVDPSEKMLTVAAERNSHPNVSYIEGGAEAIPVDDGFIDVAWLSMILHHVNDIHQCAQELSRVLKPNGELLIRNNFVEHLANARLYQFFPEALAIDVTRFPSIEETQSAFESKGFRFVATESVKQIIDTSLAKYLERVRQRAYSGLELISDEAFQQGLKRLETEVHREQEPQPVLDSVDLLLFRR